MPEKVPEFKLKALLIAVLIATAVTIATFLVGPEIAKLPLH